MSDPLTIKFEPVESQGQKIILIVNDPAPALSTTNAHLHLEVVGPKNVIYKLQAEIGRMLQPA